MQTSTANTEEDQLLPEEAGEITEEGNAQVSTTNMEEDQLVPEEPGEMTEEGNAHDAQAAKDFDDNQARPELVPPTNLMTDVSLTFYG
jgi:hypothetical protein